MATKKNLKICTNGHKFYKTSDCPTCPVCENAKKPTDNFLSLLSSPARRALENNGIFTLERLATCTEKEILKLHGMGKGTIPVLRKALGDKGLAFQE